MTIPDAFDLVPGGGYPVGVDAFDAIAAAIAALPASMRPPAKEGALLAVAGDYELTAAARAVFAFLLADLYWKKGISDRNGRLDLSTKSGFSRTAVTRALKLLRDRGHVLARQHRLSATVYERNDYTFPHVVSSVRPPQAHPRP